MEPLNPNPWTHIWTQPKKTMRAILNWDPKRIIIWLAVLGGIIGAVTWISLLWARYPEKPIVHHPLFMITVIIAGGIVGWIHLYFGGWLYQLTSSWIKGKGNFTATKCAVGWTNYPFIVADIFGILSYALSRSTPWLAAVLGIVNFVLVIWGFIIFLNLLSEAQQFSVWKALLAVIIAIVLIFVVIMLITLIIPLLIPLFSEIFI